MSVFTAGMLGQARTGGAGEDLGDLEGLREEALNLARARDRLLVLLAQLVHAQDGNDILQVLVVLRQGKARGGQGEPPKPSTLKPKPGVALITGRHRQPTSAPFPHCRTPVLSMSRQERPPTCRTFCTPRAML